MHVFDLKFAWNISPQIQVFWSKIKPGQQGKYYHHCEPCCRWNRGSFLVPSCQLALHHRHHHPHHHHSCHDEMYEICFLHFHIISSSTIIIIIIMVLKAIYTFNSNGLPFVLQCESPTAPGWEVFLAGHKSVMTLVSLQIPDIGRAPKHRTAKPNPWK